MPTKEHSWPVHPKIFEINTWPWLTNFSDIYGHNIKLDSIPIELIDQELTPYDFKYNIPKLFIVFVLKVWN